MQHFVRIMCLFAVFLFAIVAVVVVGSCSIIFHSISRHRREMRGGGGANFEKVYSLDVSTSAKTRNVYFSSNITTVVIFCRAGGSRSVGANSLNEIVLFDN